MIIQGDTFSVTFKADTIVMSGKLSLMTEDYDPIENLFQSVVEAKPSCLTLDIRNLEYLNSSGIKTICVALILEAAERENIQLKILCSKKYTWQNETIPTLKDLMEPMEIFFE
ncbi:MAG: hypothetical protein HQK75_20120 [Candidatus Magnetomorum sp.]|nr:hypothetical protein [Candidatus Magnetomorum sp.]